MKNKVH